MISALVDAFFVQVSGTSPRLFGFGLKLSMALHVGGYMDIVGRIVCGGPSRLNAILDRRHSPVLVVGEILVHILIVRLVMFRFGKKLNGTSGAPKTGGIRYLIDGWDFLRRGLGRVAVRCQSGLENGIHIRFDPVGVREILAKY